MDDNSKCYGNDVRYIVGRYILGKDWGKVSI